ncbi:MAG: YbaN family protein [Thioalkalispiraceae bacterium]|jgi:uncharacterized membrane protein YbaN (DUF454 family)
MRSFKPFYFSLGWVFFGTGVVGAFLPVLPTTPFMILALWMFSKSSDRFHDWLYNHRVFGPPLQRWHEYRVIPWPAKMASVTMMTASFVLMVLYSPMPWWSHALVGLLMLYGAWFVLSKPSFAPEQNNRSPRLKENSHPQVRN